MNARGHVPEGDRRASSVETPVPASAAPPGGDPCGPSRGVETAPLSMQAIENLTERPGDTIGNYKLLDRLGQGGCGAVYSAEQTQPVQRRVALKIIKLGMDTREVVARFEAERQALALMDHPNIAKVFDAGATETGRPYFVMELVPGVRITEYCDQHRLAIPDRLRLFIKVCKAIQHAHQKGIMHRDIKPSNVIVTINDEIPTPKVIDFGISKATSPQLLTEKTIFTAADQFLGTPAYMSPEQADRGAFDIDTRTDIYSLGVLLYELLTGRPPFGPERLLSGGVDNMRRVIREQEPPPPSTRLAALSKEDLIKVAQNRHTDSARLINSVRGDLEWIAMKAMEKDRARRYETANALANDVLRYLRNETVSARPPSRSYRVRKLIQRHRAGFAAGSITAIALVCGTVFSFWQAQRATEARDAERGLRYVAERTAADLFRSRAELFARRGDWPDAEADLSSALAIDPSRVWDWFRLAPLVVQRGDLQGYQALCDKMLAQFPSPATPMDAERLAKACLLADTGPARLRAATSLADRAVNSTQGTEYAPYYAVTKALAEYRNGRFAAAEEWVKKGLNHKELYPNMLALAYAVQGMAEYRQDRAEEGKASLAHAVQLAREPKLNDLGVDVWKNDYWPDWWHDWVIIQVLIREARELMQVSPPPNVAP